MQIETAQQQLLVVESLDDVMRLIANRVPESLTLDYKRSAAISHKALQDDIPKDVSAFANSEGGLIVYGIEEEDHQPKRIDDGVSSNDFSREQIEQAILSRIRPALPSLVIKEISLAAGRSLFALSVAKSFRTPHQAPDKKYYRRYNFTSRPLDDYEIVDLRSRRATSPPSLIHVDVRIRGGALVELVIANVGEHAAENVSFQFSRGMFWRGGDTPAGLSRPMTSMPRGRRHVYIYQSLPELLKPGSASPSEFTVTARYVHGLTGTEIREDFSFNVLDYLGSQVEETELQRLGGVLSKALETIFRELRTINGHLDTLSNTADATGLALSITTLRNLRRILRDDQGLELLNPERVDWSAFCEVLGLDLELAARLSDYFHYERQKGGKLEDVQGVTDEVLEGLKRHFAI